MTDGEERWTEYDYRAFIVSYVAVGCTLPIRVISQSVVFLSFAFRPHSLQGGDEINEKSRYLFNNTGETPRKLATKQN